MSGCFIVEALTLSFRKFQDYAIGDFDEKNLTIKIETEDILTHCLFHNSTQGFVIISYLPSWYSKRHEFTKEEFNSGSSPPKKSLPLYDTFALDVATLDLFGRIRLDHMPSYYLFYR